MQQLMVACQFLPGAVRHAGAAATLPSTRRPSRTAAVRAAASRRDNCDDYDDCGAEFGTVDEGMVVLRRRIHEMRAAERSWEPPAEWAAWEKEWYGSYDADVCELAGVLQALLMSSRPGVGVAIVAVVMLSVPTAGFLVLSQLLHASQAILSNLHPQ